MNKRKVVKIDNTKRDKRFETLCSKTQSQLKKMLVNDLKQTGNFVIEDKGYIYKEGTVPILLVAHMDTVHEKVPTEFYYCDGTITSPTGIGGDDRCGIYMIQEILKKHDCHVLFTEDEEISGVGALYFTKSEVIDLLKGKINYVIELDRMGSCDAVFYECDNKEFEDFITKEYWITNQGSYSDICDICPVIGVAGVNLSCGYYKAHTNKEYVVLDEMKRNIKEVCKLISRTEEGDMFEYIEMSYNFTGLYSRDYNTQYSRFYGTEKELYHIIYIEEVDGVEKEMIAEIYGITVEEAIGYFLINNPEMSYSQILDVYEDYY